MQHDLDDLIATSGVARLLGVSSAAISNYKQRHPDFPKPLEHRASENVTLYSRRAVVQWYLGRNPELAKAIRDETERTA